MCILIAEDDMNSRVMLQPLQIVSGFSETLLLDVDAGDKNSETLKTIKEGIDRIGELTRRIMKNTRYQAKPYLKGRIVDIHQR